MAKNSFPSFNEYQAVIQNPATCFSLPDLKSSIVETDLWGLPRVRSGGFALTYKMIHNGRSFAIRCFYKDIPDRASRYLAISEFIQQQKSDIFIPIRYLSNGIQVKSKWFPITFMHWVEGDTLEAYIAKNIDKPDKLAFLPQEFLRICNELDRLQIAHGDLSHRNIIIHRQKMVLIDYDGMYVPSLQGRKACEIGNIHFQLPGRTELQYHAEIDRFSKIVIYLALETICNRPNLWQKFEAGGEGLLFTRDDFEHPYQSKLLQAMEEIPGIKPKIGIFRRICNSDISRVPRLEDFINEKPVELSRREPLPIIPSSTTKSVIPVKPTAYPAAERIKILIQSGKPVTVVGQVTDVFRGQNENGSPHIFLNFGNWKLKCFTLVLWAEALDILQKQGVDIDSFINAWICVRGVVTVYNRRPQIIINLPTDMEVLADENEAKERLDPDYIPRKITIETAQTRPATPVFLSSLNGSLDQNLSTVQEIDRLYSRSFPLEK